MNFYKSERRKVISEAAVYRRIQNPAKHLKNLSKKLFSRTPMGYFFCTFKVEQHITEKEYYRQIYSFRSMSAGKY